MMLTILQIINELKTSAKITDKKQTLTKAYLEEKFDFFTGIQLALNPLSDFNIEKVALIESDDGTNTFSFRDFINLCDGLQKQQVGVEAIRSAAQQCEMMIWNNFYRRILLKRLDFDLKAPTVNLVLRKLHSSDPSSKRFIIPEMTFQKPYHTGTISSDVFVELDIPGTRVWIVLDKNYNRVQTFGQSFPEELQNSLSAILKFIPSSMVFDGKITQGSYGDILEQRQTTPHLAISDCMSLSDFTQMNSSMTMENRHFLLSALQENGVFARLAANKIFVVPKLKWDQSADLIQMSKVIGCGVIAKKIKSLYTFNTSDQWFKLL